MILTVLSCNVHGCASKKELIPEPQALVPPLIGRLQSKTSSTENCLRISKLEWEMKMEMEWMVDFLGTRIGAEEDLVLNSAFKITVVELEFLKLKMIIGRKERLTILLGIKSEHVKTLHLILKVH